MMKIYFKSWLSVFQLAALLSAVTLCGCVAEFNRQLEDALGPAARDKVQAIGTPNKNCALYRLNLTKTYGIVIGDHIIRLGEEFPSVRIVKQFATGHADNAVVECTRANGTVDNYLFQIESAKDANLYQLDSHSTQPFDTYIAGGYTFLTQAASNPDKLLLWTVSAGDVRGPSEGTVKSGSGTKKTSRGKVKSKAMPKIKKDNAFKLEVDTPPPASSASRASSPSVSTGSTSSPAETPYKAIEAPQLD